MGKEEKKRRRDSSSDSDSDSEDERRKGKKSKKSKDHRHKKEKKEKKHKHSSKGGDGPPPGVDTITTDDYFTKNPEYRVWLASRGKVFGDLSESETKKYFKKFVEKWNDGDLKDSLYKGLSFADVDNSARTSHKWNFAKKMDTFKSDTLRDQVLADTRSASLLAKPGAAPRQGPAQGPSSSPSGANTFESEELRDQRRAKKERVDRKVDGRHRKEESEELAPRPDPGSFQARMEKRAQKGHYCREREASPEMKQSDLMGGGFDADKARIMKQEAWKNEQRDKKSAEGAAKLEAYQEKERLKMIEFKKMMGLPLG